VATIIIIKKRPTRPLIVAIICIYLAALSFLAFLVRTPQPVIRYNYNLFQGLHTGIEFGGGMIQSLLSGKLHIRSWYYIEGILLNILLFVPVGYLVPSLFSGMRKWWRILLFACCFSLLIEMLQLITRRGMADIDDIINNTIGAAIGYTVYVFLYRRNRKASDSRPRRD